jgi:uncharacterized protein (DUF983 family)
MPCEDEIRRYQQERPVNPGLMEMFAGAAEFDPAALRERLHPEFSRLTETSRRCAVCGLELSPAGNCPRCLNLIP